MSRASVSSGSRWRYFMRASPLQTRPGSLGLSRACRSGSGRWTGTQKPAGGFSTRLLRSTSGGRLAHCMGGLTFDDVAVRAGVDPADVDDLVRLGILKPTREDGTFTQGAVQTARVIRDLEASGISRASL